MERHWASLPTFLTYSRNKKKFSTNLQAIQKIKRFVQLAKISKVRLPHTLF